MGLTIMGYLNNHAENIQIGVPFTKKEKQQFFRKNDYLKTSHDPEALASEAEVRNFVKVGLKNVEEVMLSQVTDYHSDLKAAAGLILSAGGKRMRPKIILLIGKALGADYETLISLAASIELLHTATLVHDDLIDGALLRRGISTLNANWSSSATILTGDFLFAAASSLAARTNSVEVMCLFSHTLMTIVNGEVNQLFLDCSSADIEEYHQRIYSKTASLFETSAQTAAMISNANQRQTDALAEFGCELGMAFQVVDDVLDYTGAEKKMGKPVGGDLRQGLVTLPLIYYLEQYPNDTLAKGLIRGKNNLNEEEFSQLIANIVQSDAIDKSLLDARDYVTRAKCCLMSLPEGAERAALIEICNFVVERLS